jgi:enoyl-CoA hydratase/carnithine racemase
MSQNVLREDRDGVATLTLNRPEALNALSPNLFKDLREHVDAIRTAPDRVGVVVLRANGRAFSAGADLKAMQRGEVAPYPGFQAETIDALEALPQPSIAAIHGFCFTGGMELMLGCDLAIATESAEFADTHANWGMVPGWNLCQRLMRRIGPLRAKELSYTRQRISAAMAKEIGLVNRVVPDDGLDAAIASLTAEILGGSAHSVRGYKFFYNRGQDYTFHAGLDFERREHPGRAPDLKDRVASFGKSS